MSVIIHFLDGTVKAAHFTTEHSASSYGQPVLVEDETGIAYGPNDLIGCKIEGVVPESWKKILPLR